MPQRPHWTHYEDDQLIKLKKEGLGFSRIARRLGKTVQTCKRRHYKIERERQSQGNKMNYNEQREYDHYVNVLEDYASGARKVKGVDGVERQGTRHDILGFVQSDKVADALEEVADDLGLD